MTAPRKATPKPKPRPRPKPANGPKPAPEVEHKTVTVAGREIAVKKPTQDQILVWHRVLAKLERDGQRVQEASELSRLLEKLDMILTALIVDKADAEWLENAQLLGEITLEQAGEVVTGALEAYEDELKPEAPNRAARRAKA